MQQEKSLNSGRPNALLFSFPVLPLTASQWCSAGTSVHVKCTGLRPVLPSQEKSERAAREDTWTSGAAWQETSLVKRGKQSHPEFTVDMWECVPEYSHRLTILTRVVDSKSLVWLTDRSPNALYLCWGRGFPQLQQFGNTKMNVHCQFSPISLYALWLCFGINPELWVIFLLVTVCGLHLYSESHHDHWVQN